MKIIKVFFHLERSGLEKKAFDLLNKYRNYSGFNQSQSVIQLILRNEEYIHSLCSDEQLEKMKENIPSEKKAVPDFVKNYEQNDQIDVFGNRYMGDDE